MLSKNNKGLSCITILRRWLCLAYAHFSAMVRVHFSLWQFVLVKFTANYFSLTLLLEIQWPQYSINVGSHPPKAVVALRLNAILK